MLIYLKIIISISVLGEITVLKKFGFNLKPKLAGFDNTPMLDYLDKEILTVEYSTEEIAKECFNYFLRGKYRKTLNYAIVSNKNRLHAKNTIKSFTDIKRF